MQMSGQLHALDVLLLVATEYGTVWTTEPTWKLWRREEILPLAVSGILCPR